VVPVVVAEAAEPVPRGGPSPTAVAGTTTVLLAVLAIVALRRVLGGAGAVLGPALPAAPESATQLWRTATSLWRPIGLGAPGAGDPLAAGIAGLALPLGGSTRAAIELVLVGAVPLAGLAAWLAAGAWTSSRALRCFAALAWAAAPALLLAVAAGRIGAVVAHVALPLAGLALARAARPGGRSIAAASAAGLAVTVVVAAAPVLAVPCAAVLAGTALVAHRRRVLVWSAVVPGVLLLPWWIAVARRPLLLLAEPGGPSGRGGPAGWWHLAGLPADPWALAGGPLAALGGVPATAADLVRALAVAAVVPVALLALAALLAPRRGGRGVGTSWLAALAGLAVAGVAPLLTATATAGGDVHTHPGPGLSLWWLGLLSAAVARADGAASALRASRSVGVPHVVAVVTGALAVAAPVAALALWTATGAASDPGDAWVHRGVPDVLPAVAVAEAEGPAATRTLVLRVTADGVRWSLERRGAPTLGDASAAVTADPATAAPGGSLARSGQAQLLGAVGDLLSDAGSDERGRLSDLGIGSILLLPPVDDAVLGALDTAPGLVRVPAPDGAALWRVQLAASPGRPSRVRVLGPDGTALEALPAGDTGVTTTLQAGPAGRLLVLAERADPGWRATLDGHRLPSGVHAGWAQAFELPAWGGRLEVEHRAPYAAATGAAQLVVAGLALLLAVPLPRRRFRLRPPPGRRRDRPVDLAALAAEGSVTWPVPVVPAQREALDLAALEDRHHDLDALDPDHRKEQT
jgi:hypothetical protein